MKKTNGGGGVTLVMLVLLAVLIVANFAIVFIYVGTVFDSSAHNMDAVIHQQLFVGKYLWLIRIVGLLDVIIWFTVCLSNPFGLIALWLTVCPAMEALAPQADSSSLSTFGLHLVFQLLAFFLLFTYKPFANLKKG